MPERLLIVGLGSIGMRHARLVRELLPDTQLFALRRASVGPGAVPGFDAVVTSMDDALRLRPEAAVIASPATCHLESAIPLAKAGIHLLIEKPIAGESTVVSDLIEASCARRTVLMTGYNLRFLPSLRKFREFLAQRLIGRVISVRAEIGQFLPSWRPGTDYRKSVSAQSALGGGALMELSHEIDYLRWLFGEVGWVSAVLRKQSRLEVDVEDTAHLTLGVGAENGGSELVLQLSMDFVRHDTVRCCTAIGEGGSLRWNGLSGLVEIFEPGQETWRTLFSHPHNRDESYVAQWRHFLDCIEGRDTPLVSGADGLKTLRVIEAARLSSNSGSVVSLHPAEYRPNLVKAAQ